MVRPGQAVRIFTGAPVPEGADTMVMQEDVSAARRAKSGLTRQSAPAAISVARGLDFAEGRLLLGTGHAA